MYVRMQYQSKYLCFDILFSVTPVCFIKSIVSDNQLTITEGEESEFEIDFFVSCDDSGIKLEWSVSRSESIGT